MNLRGFRLSRRRIERSHVADVHVAGSVCPAMMAYVEADLINSSAMRAGPISSDGFRVKGFGHQKASIVGITTLIPHGSPPAVASSNIPKFVRSLRLGLSIWALRMEFPSLGVHSQGFKVKGPGMRVGGYYSCFGHEKHALHV